MELLDIFILIFAVINTFLILAVLSRFNLEPLDIPDPKQLSRILRDHRDRIEKLEKNKDLL